MGWGGGAVGGRGAWAGLPAAGAPGRAGQKRRGCERELTHPSLSHRLGASSLCVKSHCSFSACEPVVRFLVLHSKHNSSGKSLGALAGDLS